MPAGTSKKKTRGRDSKRGMIGARRSLRERRPFAQASAFPAVGAEVGWDAVSPCRMKAGEDSRTPKADGQTSPPSRFARFTTG